MAIETEPKKRANQLINETSPYLLEHAYNPVNWYPWSDEAFESAKKQNKPVFLSIGYSTCHWCHVMAHESFENAEIARIMNEHFISIKVDREHRPDVDNVYMTAVQMMTGSGGWPLSVFLTPQGEPFFGGTYFPPEDTFAQRGFKSILLTVAQAWKNRRDELVDSAGKISDIIAIRDDRPDAEKLSTDIFKKAYSDCATIFDPDYGGFGRSPKFPQPHNLSMLMRYWHRTGEDQALKMVETTLNAMADGGIYDHLAGGFHRYSTDAVWLVPHFEKMLYDQALLCRAYLRAYQITQNQRYAGIAREILEYVLRDMTDPKGGFYSAEDADSEGREGTFYLWEPNEIQQIIGAEHAKIFKLRYGVTKRGNFEEGKTILHISKSLEQLHEEIKLTPGRIENILSKARQKLFYVRAKRPRPHRDEKIITAWNGLMISSFALGGQVLGEEKYTKAAQRAARFVLTELQKDGRLMRYYAKRRAVEPGFLNDYAFMITGLFDLYEADFDASRLAEAKRLAGQMVELFGDPDRGGFFLAASDSEQLITRNKPAYDGSMPSGNSVAALALLRLGQATMTPRFIDHGLKTLQYFSEQLRQSPGSLAYMLLAVDFLLCPRREIVIAGDAGSDDTKQMLKLIRSRFLPNTVVLFHQMGQAGEPIEKIVPFIAAQKPIDSKATAYVCENYTCKQPINNLAELEKALSNISQVD
ncbi:MAG TPA: thioredoxin domain-containing protein [Planctomycetes bacterium]|nr:thioredoxin domain-containing protein [Planctomycetota bacterium]